MPKASDSSSLPGYLGSPARLPEPSMSNFLVSPKEGALGPYYLGHFVAKTQGFSVDFLTPILTSEGDKLL